MGVTTPSESEKRQQKLTYLLEETSRTFALSIPFLPEPMRSEVTISYLLFRIADTLEDATAWTASFKVEQLQRFDRLLVDGTSQHYSKAAEDWTQQPPLEHEGYRELLRETPLVFDALSEQSKAAQREIVRFTRDTTRRMASFVERSDETGWLRLKTIQDLRDYCYAVAGLVGEMLTELFILSTPSLTPVAAELRKDAATFGEALQLVNILKDAATDSGEGRQFLPENVPVAEVFELARNDLKIAARYVHRLQKADAATGVVAFCAAPVLLASEALKAVEVHGPGSKIKREQVLDLVGALLQRLDQNEPALPDAITT